MSRHTHHQTTLVIATIGCLLALVFALPSYAGKAQIVGEVVD